MSESRSPTITHLLSHLRAKLKSSRLRAADLAAELGVSEPTIWRWLRGDGLNLDGLDKICEILGVDLREALLSEQDDVEDMFTLAQERVLAADRSLALVFFAILHGAQAAEITRNFRLPKKRLDQHLQRLERLGLLRKTRRGWLKSTVKRSVRWHRGGPLSHAFNNTVKHLFLSQDFGDPKSDYVSDMVAITPIGRARILALFEKLREDIHLIGQQEREASVPQREWSGILMMITPFDINELTEEWADNHASQ